MTVPPHAPAPRERRRALVAAAGLGVFVACFVAAAAIYPGGTWFDRRAEGHSLWKNFLCDLMQTRALNGAPTPTGSVLAQVGMLAMVAALASFFLQVADLASKPTRASLLTRRAGLLACALSCAVPMVPSNLFRGAHVAVVVVAFVPGLVATVAALAVCMRTPGLWAGARAAAILTVTTGAIDGLAYAYVYLPTVGVDVARTPLVPWALPVFQRLATFGLVAWIAAVSMEAWLRAGVSSDRGGL